MPIARRNDNIKSKIKTREERAYMCKYNYLHDYSEKNLEKLEKEYKNNKTYNNVKELMEDIEEKD